MEYQSIVDFFTRANRFLRIAAETQIQVSLLWPDGVGVYVVRLKDPDSRWGSVLYVGMTGKIKKNRLGQLVAGGSGFQGRKERYTPYCYTSVGRYADHFEFGPNASGDAVLELNLEERYQDRHPLNDIVTDCFILTGVETHIAPSFLEALLLQTFISQQRSLPPGNNAF